MYAVMRFQKLKTMGQVAAAGSHNERTRETRNADAARHGQNERLAGSGNWQADVQARLDTQEKIRANAVLALDFVFTASRDFFADGSPTRLHDWCERTMAWLRDRFGGENVVAAILHRDEMTPHIQALVVPIDERGKLAAKTFIGTPAKVSDLQTGYARAVEDLGLQRGVQGSVADHQAVRDYYAKIETPTPAPEIVREGVTVDRPGRLVTNPERWAADQTERITEHLTPTLDAALVKAQHYEQQAARAEANIVVLQRQVREVQQERDTLREDYRALAAQVRAIDMPTVIERLGGVVDRYNAHKWHVNGEHISITDERFYNHDRQQGGGGAIDLVMHAAGYDYRQAVAYLRDTHGAGMAISAAALHGARQAQHDAQEIVQHAERPPFQPPAPNDGRWSEVRHYLVLDRALPARMVDDLHQRGVIYADHRSNAVFLRQDADGNATGASLRGTLPGSAFKGLAAGTRRDEGHFSFTIGQPAPYMAPQVHIVESPIDALSRAALLLRDGARGEYHFVSTDGHGSLPRRQIDEGLARGALVHCGFDNDAGCDSFSRNRSV